MEQFDDFFAKLKEEVAHKMKTKFHTTYHVDLETKTLLMLHEYNKNVIIEMKCVYVGVIRVYVKARHVINSLVNQESPVLTLEYPKDINAWEVFRDVEIAACKFVDEFVATYTPEQRILLNLYRIAMDCDCRLEAFIRRTAEEETGYGYGYCYCPERRQWFYSSINSERSHPVKGHPLGFKTNVEQARECERRFNKMFNEKKDSLCNPRIVSVEKNGNLVSALEVDNHGKKMLFTAYRDIHMGKSGNEIPVVVMTIEMNEEMLCFKEILSKIDIVDERSQTFPANIAYRLVKKTAHFTTDLTTSPLLDVRYSDTFMVRWKMSEKFDYFSQRPLL